MPRKLHRFPWRVLFSLGNAYLGLSKFDKAIEVFEQAQGAGIISSDHSRLIVTNSTISGNSASPFQGGGIRNSGGPASISSSTIVGNSSGPNPFQSAGGIFNVAAVVTVKNSIVANNINGDCFSSASGSIASLGGNFSTSSCPGFNVVTPVQLKLGPLSNNGVPHRHILCSWAALPLMP